MTIKLVQSNIIFTFALTKKHICSINNIFMRNIVSLIGIIPLSIVLLTGCNIEKKQSGLERGISVKVQEVEPTDKNTQSQYIGIVEESVSVPVSFLTTGQVAKVYVTEGQKVKKGQLLAELDNSSYQNMYQMAFSKEKQAQDAYSRLSELYKKGSLPEIKYIEIQTAVDQARSAAQIALKNLDDCKLYAPMDGVIGMRSIEPGMSVLPSVTMIKLVKIDKVFIKVPVPENELSKINVGHKATITITALDNELFKGIIEEKGVIANPLSHTYSIKIAVSNPEEKLKPGMVCKVAIQENISMDQVFVPSNVIQTDEKGQKYLFVADSITCKAVKKYVEPGSPYKNGVIIAKGLQAGDQLIVEGYQKVSENAAIEIVK